MFNLAPSKFVKKEKSMIAGFTLSIAVCLGVLVNKGKIKLFLGAIEKPIEVSTPSDAKLVLNVATAVQLPPSSKQANDLRDALQACVSANDENRKNRDEAIKQVVNDKDNRPDGQKNVVKFGFRKSE